jgi:hypothetical protein
MALEDLEVEISAETASFVAGVETAESQLDGLSSEAIQTASALEILSGRANDAEGEVDELGRSAVTTAGSFSLLSGASTTLNLSLNTLSASVAVSLVPALVLLSSTLAPLIGAMGGFAAVAGAIAGIGIVGAMGAIATNTQQLTDRFTGLLNLIETQFAPLFDMATSVLLVFLGEFANVVPALVPAEETLETLAAQFAQLGTAVIDALPALVELATTLATEFLPPFVDFAQDLLPQVPGMIRSLVTTFRRLLPQLMEAGRLTFQLLGPLTDLGFTVLQVLGPSLARLATELTTVIRWFNTLGAGIQDIGAQLGLTLPLIAGVASLLGGPLTIALGAVVGAVVGLARAWQNNFANIQTVATRLFTQLQRHFGAVRDAFDAFVSGIDFGQITAAVQDFESVLGAELMTTLTALQPVFADMEAFLRDNRAEFRILGGVVSDLVSGLLRVGGVIVNVLGVAFRTVAIPALRTFIDAADLALTMVTDLVRAFNALAAGNLQQALEIGATSEAPADFAELIGAEGINVQEAREAIGGFVEGFAFGGAEIPRVEGATAEAGTQEIELSGELVMGDDGQLRAVIDERVQTNGRNAARENRRRSGVSPRE